jgi:hypothetical protein
LGTILQIITLKIQVRPEPWLIPVILTIQDVLIRRIMVPGQPRQKVSEIVSQLIKYGCLASQLCEKHKLEDLGLGWSGQKMQEPIPKIPKAKRAEDVA